MLVFKKVFLCNIIHHRDPVLVTLAFDDFDILCCPVYVCPFQITKLLATKTGGEQQLQQSPVQFGFTGRLHRIHFHRSERFFDNFRVLYRLDVLHRAVFDNPVLCHPGEQRCQNRSVRLSRRKADPLLLIGQPSQHIERANIPQRFIDVPAKLLYDPPSCSGRSGASSLDPLRCQEHLYNLRVAIVHHGQLSASL